MANITINGVRKFAGVRASVEITERAKTVKATGYVWAGHQSIAAEGALQEVSVVRPTLREALAELRRRWNEQSGASSYVGFGGQFRHVEHMSRQDIEEVFDAVAEHLEEVKGEEAALAVA